MIQGIYSLLRGSWALWVLYQTQLDSHRGDDRKCLDAVWKARAGHGGMLGTQKRT